MLTKNHLDLTRDSIETLLRARGAREAEWVVVDCESSDGTLRYLKGLARDLDLTVLICPDEEPFVYGRTVNRGAAAARGEYLVFANNDIRNRSSRVIEEFERVLSIPRVGVVGVEALGAGRGDLAELPRYTRCLMPMVGYMWGVRSETFWELGAMDEELDGYGHDEVEFQYRAVRARYDIALVREPVEHLVNSTFGKGIWQTGLGLRNQLLCDARHGWGQDRGQFEQFRAHARPDLSILAVVRPGDHSRAPTPPAAAHRGCTPRSPSPRRSAP